MMYFGLTELTGVRKELLLYSHVSGVEGKNLDLYPLDDLFFKF